LESERRSVERNCKKPPNPLKGEFGATIYTYC